MDGLEFSKILGVGCAGLLAFVGLGIASEGIVSVASLDEPAYGVEIAEAEDGDKGEAEVLVAAVSAEALEAADADNGAGIFKGKCSACHNIEQGQPHKVGPTLYGVMGEPIGRMDDYSYSNALLEKDGDWQWTSMNGFLWNPKKWAPGTKMGFAGLRKEEDRVDVMAYLNSYSDKPIATTAVEVPEENLEASNPRDE